VSAYSNDLEKWYGGLPGPVQSILDVARYHWVNDALHWIAGEPDKVAGLGPQYVAQGEQVKQLATQITTIKNSMTAWTGQAHDAFDASMVEMSGNFTQLGDAVVATDEVLKACAEACVAQANLVIDLFKSLIEFLLTSLAVSAAMAVFTFGASIAAWIAANIAKGLATLAKVVSSCEKLAAFLMKLAQLFVKIAKVLIKIAELLIKLWTKWEKIKKAKIWGSKADFLAKLAIQIPVLKAADAVTPGPVHAPSGVGEGRDAVGHGADGVNAAGDAEDAANGHRPPGY